MLKNHISQIPTAKSTKLFGTLPDNREVLHYTLRNKKGFELSVINYGAVITSLKVPTADNTKTDIVLGFDTLDDYINSFDLSSAPYFGAVVGRYAGRINNGAFILNGKKIQLTQNHNSHQIHGGLIGFSRKFWKVKSISENENPSITLTCKSKNNEENFPGEITVAVTYTLTETNELNVTFTATSTEDTVVNLTQHSYFNLEGHSNDIINQMLTVNSNKILETTAELIPTGNYIDLKNHPFNFITPKFCPHSIDNTFILKSEKAASLFSIKNKIKMTVFTNQPAVHIYVGGNCFDRISGKEKANYHPKSGICFETQNFPDAPNHNSFPNPFLKKGEVYLHQTSFKFEPL